MTEYNELRDGQDFYGNGYKQGYKQAILNDQTNFKRPQDETIDKVKEIVDEYYLSVVNKASTDIKAYLFDKILDVFAGDD